MLEQYVISDIKQLKALSHASRVRILSVLTEKPMTAKQLADHFGEEPAKTSYHVKQLLKVGLVELKFTRPTQNGIIEKYYLSVAKEFQTDPNLARWPGGRTRVEASFLRELNKTQSDFLRAYRADLEQGKPETSTAHGTSRLGITADNLPKFQEDLKALISKYSNEEGSYSFHFLTYPVEAKQKRSTKPRADACSTSPTAVIR